MLISLNNRNFNDNMKIKAMLAIPLPATNIRIVLNTKAKAIMVRSFRNISLSVINQNKRNGKRFNNRVSS